MPDSNGSVCSQAPAPPIVSLVNEETELAHTIAEEAARAELEGLAPWPVLDPDYSGTWYEVTKAEHPEPMARAVRYLELRGLLLRHPLRPGLVQFRDRMAFVIRPERFQGSPGWRLMGESLHPNGQIYDRLEDAASYAHHRCHGRPGVIRIHWTGQPVEVRLLPAGSEPSRSLPFQDPARVLQAGGKDPADPPQPGGLADE